MCALVSCCRSRSHILLPLRLFNEDELFLVPLEVGFELGRSMKKFSRHAMNLALHIELVALDLQYRVLTLTSLIQDQTLL